MASARYAMPERPSCDHGNAARPDRNRMADHDFRFPNHGHRQHLAAGGIQGDRLDLPQRLPGGLIHAWCPGVELVRCSGIRVQRTSLRSCRFVTSWIAVLPRGVHAVCSAATQGQRHPAAAESDSH